MAISEIQLPSGDVYRFEDVGDYYLYSAADFQSGATDTELIVFNYTESGPVSGTQDGTTAPTRTATDRDTNQITANKMSDDEAMSIFSTRIFVEEATITDGGTANDGSQSFTRPQPIPSLENLGRFNRLWTWRLDIMGDKPFDLHRVGFFSAGWGPTGFIAGGTISVGSFGVSSHQAARRMAIPVVLPPTQTFSGIFRNSAGLTFNLVTPGGVESDNVQLRTLTTLLGPRQRDVGRAAAGGMPTVRRYDAIVNQ